MRNLIIGGVVILVLLGVGLFILFAPPPAVGKLYTYTSDDTGLSSNTYFYDSGTEVVVFNTQLTNALADKAISYLRTQTNNPITYLVITDTNAESFNAITAYKQSGVSIIASKQAADAFPAAYNYFRNLFAVLSSFIPVSSYPELGTADTTFSNSYTLTLKSGQKIYLQELSQPGETSNHVVAYIPGIKSLIVGNLVYYKVHAWMNGGIEGGGPVPTLDPWIIDLKGLLSTFKNDASITVYPGHGVSAPLTTALPEQIGYLEKVRDITDQYFTGLGANARTEFSGKNAKVHFQAIVKQVTDAFPGYTQKNSVVFNIDRFVSSRLK